MRKIYLLPLQAMVAVLLFSSSLFAQQVKIETATLATGVYTVEANGSSHQIIRMMVQH